MHLLIPDLLLPRAHAREVLADLPLPGLARLLAQTRETRREEKQAALQRSLPATRWLLDAFGHAADLDRAPIVQALRAADGLDGLAAHWHLVQPCHFAVARDHVQLGIDRLALRPDEAQALLASARPLLDEDGIAVEVGPSGEHGKPNLDVKKLPNRYGSDAEGAGDMFRVTTLPVGDPPRTEDGQVELWAGTQGIHVFRAQCARLLQMDVSKIRVTPAELGGGFGGKSGDDNCSVIAAMLARRSGKPVKLIHTREEEFLASHPRMPMRYWVKLGFSKAGKVLAKEIKMWADNGAYTGPTTGTRAATPRCRAMPSAIG